MPHKMRSLQVSQTPILSATNQPYSLPLALDQQHSKTYRPYAQMAVVSTFFSLHSN